MSQENSKMVVIIFIVLFLLMILIDREIALEKTKINKISVRQDHSVFSGWIVTIVILFAVMENNEQGRDYGGYIFSWIIFMFFNVMYYYRMKAKVETLEKQEAEERLNKEYK